MKRSDALATITRTILQYNIGQYIPWLPADVEKFARAAAPLLSADENDIQDAMADA